MANESRATLRILKRFVLYPQPANNRVERHRILYKMKYDEVECAQGSDFLTYFEGYMDADELLDENTRWSTYAITRTQVYFVRMPHPLRDYNAAVCPFIYMRQFIEAEAVAVMDIATFARVFKTTPDRLSSVIFVSSTPRSGTTLFSVMVHIDGKVTSFSEPDIFTSIAELVDNRQNHNFSDRTLADIIDASLRACLVTVPKDHHVFIKTQCMCNALVPHMKQYLPAVRHLFITRRHTRKGIVSTEKIYNESSRSVGVSRTVITLQPLLPRAIIDWLFARNRTEGSWQYKLQPRSTLEYAWIIYAVPFSRFLANKGMYDRFLSFEDFLKQPEKILMNIYETFGCNINQETVEKLATRLNKDSQATTALSNKVLSTVSHTEITEDLRQKANKYATLLKLPRDFFTEDDYFADIPSC